MSAEEITPLRGLKLAERVRNHFPKDLLAVQQWVMWRYEDQKGRMTKVPYTTGGRRAKTSDSSTWSTSEHALRALEQEQFDGVGFVFTRDDPWFGIDLDNKEGEPFGKLPTEFEHDIEAMSTYAERSPSGTGVHIIGRGKLPKGFKKGVREAYDSGRYFTVTGDCLTPAVPNAAPVQVELDKFIATRFAPSPKSTPSAQGAFVRGDHEIAPDQMILERLTSNPPSNHVGKLFAGIWNNHYPSQSEADLALAGHLLAETGGDIHQADRLFRRSGLYRPKWDERRGGTTYGERTLREASASSQCLMAPGALLQQMNDRFAVIRTGGRVCILEEHLDAKGHRAHTLLNEASFRIQTAPLPKIGKATAAVWWLQHPLRREFEGIVFSPGHCPAGYYNLWQGFTFPPSQGTSTRFWQFVLEVICDGNQEHYQYVRKFLAHMVQRPFELPGVALVLRGKQGTGKSVFANAVGALVGKHFVTVARTDQLAGKFNSHLGGALVCHAAEAFWGGNKADQGQLKSAITDPTMLLERKGLDAIQVENFMRLIISSNENWAAPLDADDRRFLALNVSPKFARNEPYFDALHQELNSGGYAAIMYDLANESLSGWSPRTKPYSPHAWDLKIRSGDSVVRWLLDQLIDPTQEGNIGYVPSLHLPGFVNSSAASVTIQPRSSTPPIPPTALIKQLEVNKSKIRESYLDWCRKHHEYRPLEESFFFRRLNEILPGQFTERKGPRPSRSRVLVFKSLRSCRRQFESSMQNKIPWRELRRGS